MRQPLSLIIFLSSLLTYPSFPTPTLALPKGQLPAVTQDTGQVTINPNPTTANQPTDNIPIRATIYSGVPGPSHCRGHPILLLDLPIPPLSPSGILATTAPKCYNIPSSPSSSNTAGVAGCGVFSASKSSGCEARVFAEPGCRGYLNTVVFIPEERAVGGQWRSLEVRCGVKPPDEEALGRPPLVGLMGTGGMRVKENKKSGKRWVS
ncbi:hypothetical protein B0T20DRAFT_475896 [Sordaria brevicollis]|uniref:Uncharacterized protein n=1 Tax=Sordaria brevicollis TaxID=83679 RepID=A0AAE0PLJ1_SORBR|nr:hypothetical protein B0T20DRAFT_475896 [Sordaria brevicollis]